jgi:L-alanine-DL-glutamate epimerase-like enolase superfamily enzyme
VRTLRASCGEEARGEPRKARYVRIDVVELALPLVHTFTIARGSQPVASTAIVRLYAEGRMGIGECAPSKRYGESVASVRTYFRENKLASDDPFAIEELLANVPPAARCALDVALYDLIGKTLERPLWQLFGLDERKTPATSFTIGIAEPAEMLARLEAIREHPIVKVKLGFADDIEVVAAMRARYSGILRVDANEAWTPEEAVAKLAVLEKYGIEFCEQPIPAGSPEKLRYITERSRVPIVTDEDSKDASDLAALRGCVDGINIKLVKCGGIRGALAMIHTARALGLRIMLGCMVESAVLSTAAAHLSPLVDWADLDGPFLTAADPFVGITYDKGKIVLPSRPGLGVIEREPLEAYAVA